MMLASKLDEVVQAQNTTLRRMKYGMLMLSFDTFPETARMTMVIDCS